MPMPRERIEAFEAMRRTGPDLEVNARNATPNATEPCYSWIRPGETLDNRSDMGHATKANFRRPQQLVVNPVAKGRGRCGTGPLGARDTAGFNHL